MSKNALAYAVIILWSPVLATSIVAAWSAYASPERFLVSGAVALGMVGVAGLIQDHIAHQVDAAEANHG